MANSEDLASQATDGTIEVLRAGAEEDLGARGFYAPATITAVKIRDVHRPKDKVAFAGLIDTGFFGEGAVLKTLLFSHGIPYGAVCEVYLTHNHPDHAGNVALFEDATIVGPDSIYSVRRPNRFTLLQNNVMAKPGQKIINSGIPGFDRAKIISTPGHAGQDLSVLYEGRNGLVAVVGDLFWSQHDWEHDSEFSGLCVNSELQKRSREYIRSLKPAVVVPGHGPAFAPKY